MGTKRLTTIILVCVMVLSYAAPPTHVEAGGGSFGGGDGSASDPYVIEDVWDLQNMGSNLSAHYVLGRDIDASATATWNSGEGFAPVGDANHPFTGSLDGRDHTITGLYINRSTSNGVGLFGYVDLGGLVMNVGLVDCDVTGYEYVGALVGRVLSGTVDNCHATGSVAGTNDVGGLVGTVSSGTVSDCHAAVVASGTWETGGLVGSNGGTMSICHATGSVNGTRLHVGGLVGYNHGEVDNCTATGKVEGASWYVGGLAGYNRGAVSNSSAAGRVDGTQYVGGLVGYSRVSDFNSRVAGSSATGDVCGTAYVGGLVGYSSCPVSNCSAAGEVATNGSFAGGLLGFHAVNTVYGSHATGNVTGSGDVGGLVGMNEHGTVHASYATGAVTAMDTAGGLVGFHLGTITCSRAEGDVSGNFTIGGLVGFNIGIVSMSFASGNVTGGSWIGGFVGINVFYGTVSDSYSTGDVTGSDPVGGFVGFANESTVSNSYSAGRVTGTGDVGGFVGLDNGSTASGCFWDTETSGLSSSPVGTGRTTAEMRTRSTFTDAGWDLASVWCMIENVTYPLLRWQDAGPPAARAGPDQTVDEGTLVTFDGSSSSDDIGIADLEWTFEDGTTVTLHGLRPSHRFERPGTFVVTLNVTDAVDLWDVDTMTVIVNDVTAPVADAGPDQTVSEGQLVTFDGSGSSDAVGVVNHTWTFTDGAPITLRDARPTYRFGSPGVFVVALEVADAAGNMDTDTVTVTVLDVTPPVPDAGEDVVVDQDGTVHFDGSDSWDNVGATGWVWTFEHGGEPVRLEGVSPSYVFTVAGVYQVTLNVTDAAGNWATDVLSVTVRDVTPPSADAGEDRVVDQRMEFWLDGSDSTDDVGVVQWEWTVVLPGGNVTLTGVEVSYELEEPGVYLVVLEVRDGAGNVARDEVTVTVIDAEPPVADAGADATSRVGRRVVLDGSGSRDNVGVTRWTWTFVHKGKTVELTGETVEFTFERAGEYEVTLTVEDARGLEDVDTVLVEVEAREGGSLLMYVVILVVIVAVVLAALLVRRTGRTS